MAGENLLKARLCISLFALIILASCTTAHPTALPGGGQGYMVGCSGIQHTMTDCYARSAEICPAGYDIVATDQSSTPFINPYNRSMFIQCR